jgi:hypothetical protein
MVPADSSLADERRPEGRQISLSSLGGVAAILLGPPVGVLAWRLGMGPVEACAMVFLLSGWLGPKLMHHAGS